MASPSGHQPDVVIDACCLVNFCAVDASLACLGEFGLSWRLPAATQSEGLYIRVSSDSSEAVRIDIDPAIQAGLIETCIPAEGPETELYVHLAQELDDGEAMALAIAKARGWALATDDRKAKRQAKELSVRTWTTPELMRRRAERMKHPKPLTAEALRRIETLARFVPASGAPDAKWWRGQLGD